jgi:hypothetical protein
MTPRQLRETFAERPELLLALMLSTPELRTAKAVTSVTVDFTESEVIARVQHPEEARRSPRLLPTKQTIFAAILLYHLIERRGPDFAASLVERAEEFGERAAVRNAEFRPRTAAGWYPPAQSPDAESSTFFQELDISPADLEAAQSKTEEAVDFLEAEGLAVDPAFTPELMVLAGLVPMHFSVRTPKGERVYREIKINAALWSLDVTRGTKNGRPYTDVDFRLRGIEIVRKAITAMATHYLETEEKVRRNKGQPVLRRKGSPELDGE